MPTSSQPATQATGATSSAFASPANWMIRDTTSSCSRNAASVIAAL